jgi:gluconate 2-dehydrogenase gamma chain
MAKAKELRPDRMRVSRRGFLKGSGVALTAAGAMAVVGPACGEEDVITPGVTEPDPGTIDDPTPGPPAKLPGDMLRFFSSDEAATIEAITARILPGDLDDPGAREAGVVWYIDAALAHDHGFNQPIYTAPPFAEFVDKPPEQTDKAKREISKSEKERYGFQSSLTPRETYRAALVSLSMFVKGAYGGRAFADLSEAEQDEVVRALEQDQAQGFDKPSAKDFFKQLRDDTIDGMFSDPAYGGNRNMVGWKLISYPGAQRAYPAGDLQTENAFVRRGPQSLAEMKAFHPGLKNHEGPILPVSGSDIPRHHH